MSGSCLSRARYVSCGGSIVRRGIGRLGLGSSSRLGCVRGTCGFIESRVSRS